MGDEKQLEININQGETQEYFADIAGFAKRMKINNLCLQRSGEDPRKTLKT